MFIRANTKLWQCRGDDDYDKDNDNENNIIIIILGLMSANKSLLMCFLPTTFTRATTQRAETQTPQLSICSNFA